MLTTSPNDCPPGTTVLMVKPRAPHEIADAVVLTARVGRYPLAGGGTIEVWDYELHWPDGSTTWHLRHKFQPIEAS